jgi:O-antigen/teichoic acid export membrane protein
MTLLNNDMLWVNRVFAAEMAGSYATAVVLRRVLAVLPGAAVVVMYPRVVAQVARRELPDGLLGWTAGAVIGITLCLTLVYFAFGPAVVHLTFGGGYERADPLLGWMGIAMLGYGLTSVWMNLYLATRPTLFVALLVVGVVSQSLLMALRHATLAQVTAVFSAVGWLLALGGFVLYVFWLRPQLKARDISGLK